MPWPPTDGVVLDDGTPAAMRAATLCMVAVEGDGASVWVRGQGQVLAVRGAASATVYVAVRTGFENWCTPPTRDLEECVARCATDVQVAGAAGWAAVHAAHVAGHRAVMDRVRLDLDGAVPDLSTDVRLARRARGDRDEHLCVLVFAFGRYLLAAASRPGTQSATLQGVWNDQLAPPWNCQTRSTSTPR